MSRPVPLLVAITLAVTLLTAALASCSHGPAVEGPGPVHRGKRVVFVSLGGDETVGDDLGFPSVVQDRWTQLVFHDGLPTRAVHINLAGRRRLIGDGAAEQLDLALEAAPTIATIWFGPGDDADGTPPAVFRADLTTMVRRLMAVHARVLVATRTGSRYDADIEQVVGTERATAVSVAGLPDPLGRAGHAEVAKRFERAIGPTP